MAMKLPRRPSLVRGLSPHEDESGGDDTCWIPHSDDCITRIPIGGWPSRRDEGSAGSLGAPPVPLCSSRLTVSVDIAAVYGPEGENFRILSWWAQLSSYEAPNQSQK